jgi:hypothetical protein
MAVLLTLILVSAMPVSAVDSPETFFGFQPGSDRELIDYEQLIEYLQLLDSGSNRLQLTEVGASPQGRPMYVAFISAEENIAALERLRTINRRLALEPDLDQATRDDLVEEGRVFVMATLSMHSSEVGPSQSLPIFAHELVTTTDEALLARLHKVVMMVVPCHNPDGMDMVVHHYLKHKGTKYEGSSMPGIYHQYAGHDNNRDFINLSQADTRVIARLYSRDWLPQVMVEKHQMGSTGPRYFVPPFHDPIAQNIDKALWLWSGTFGANLARDMGEDGHSGVAQHWVFDNYWPGSTETSLWKNVISFLTEAASCKTAKPIFVEPTELSVRGKGLAEYKKSVNMPEPWPGGWWRLGDIVAYELSSFHSVLKTAAQHDKEILRFRNDICREEVARGRNQAPYYFVMPAQQHDRSALLDLVRLLEEHGVVIKRLSADAQVDGRAFIAGDLLVPLSQPFRAFVKEVMEVQQFPVRHYTPGGEMIRPYDITSWSLPLHRGVTSWQVDSRSLELEAQLEDVTAKDLAADIAALPKSTRALAYPATDNESYKAAFVALGKGLKLARLEQDTTIDGKKLPAGTFLVRGGAGKLDQLAGEIDIPPQVLLQQLETGTVELTLPKIALVETWFHDMDAGWTRFVLDSYSIPYQVLRPVDLKEADLESFDVVVLPDSDSGVLKEGRYKRANRYYSRDYPPEYSKGMGDKGLQNLVKFLDQGGIIVSWRQSTALFMEGLKLDKPKSGKGGENNEEAESEHFRLPVRDLTESRKQLYVPGTFLAIDVLPDHPLTWGMPERSGVFSRGTPVLQTSIPTLDMDRRVVAAFPADEDDILVSGFAEGEEGLANTPAMVWISKGKGQLVLFSFNPQFRSSTPATYKLLFNALLLP